MLRRLVRGLLAGIGILLLAATAAFLVLCWQINRTGASDQAQPADAIVILGARVEPDGQPGPDLRVRTLHAVSLYRQGLAPYLVCTGGYKDDRLSAAAVACKLAVSEGVPEDRVFLADGSMTTGEDAASTRDLAAAHGWRTAILVSHPAAPGTGPHPVRGTGHHRLPQPDQHRSDGDPAGDARLADASRGGRHRLDRPGKGRGALRLDQAVERVGVRRGGVARRGVWPCSVELITGWSPTTFSA